MNFSYEKIEGCCNDLHRVANQMKETLGAIATTVSKIENSGIWTGRDATYYTKKMKKLISNFDEVYQEMEMAVLYLADVSDGYQALESSFMGEICNNLNMTTPSYAPSKIFGEVPRDVI